MEATPHMVKKLTIRVRHTRLGDTGLVCSEKRKKKPNKQGTPVFYFYFFVFHDTGLACSFISYG